MKRLRVLVVTGAGLIPPDNAAEHSEEAIAVAPWKMEYDVLASLRALGHESRIIGVFDDLGVMRQGIENFKPHVVFNLVHEFHGVGVYDHHIAAYLELLKQPYTGCNPRGLLLSHDKVLAKQLMLYHRIATPRFLAYPRKQRFRKPGKLQFPILVKSTVEDASWGLSQASVVTSDEKLKERIEFVHDQIGTDALVEEYIEGRELYLSVLGNTRLQTFPAWEIVFPELPDGALPIATRKAKWDGKYRQKHKIHSRAAYKLPETLEKQLSSIAKRIFRTLYLTGYARLDCRLRPDGKLYCLEANANPDISFADEFASAAEKAGLSHEALVQRILTLALSYEPEWKRYGS
ncbi:MAG: hypothetical protein KDD69_17575 [Bdellovibrionales bacterium]|nr:hypothetical protein [Bdellovibrionales bacterium]